MNKQNKTVPQNPYLGGNARYTVYLKHPNRTLTAEGLGDADSNWILQNHDNAIIVPKDNVAYIVENIDRATRDQIIQQQLENQVIQQQEVIQQEGSEPGNNIDLGFDTGLDVNVQRGT